MTEKKARHVRICTTKCMLIVFFGNHGIVHQEFVPNGRTMNSELYCQVLGYLREAFSRTQVNLGHTRSWMLHDDNAPCHRSLHTSKFLAGTNMVPTLLIRFGSHSSQN